MRPTGSRIAVDRGISTFPRVILSRTCGLVGPTILLALALGTAAGDWSNRADLPGNPRLADLDRAGAESRFQGKDRSEIEVALGTAGRQILVPTADGGWIEWDAGSPDRAQTWVYTLRRVENRRTNRRESRRENRRLVVNFDDRAKVASVGWSCDTTAWR